MNVLWRERITIEPGKRGGQPCIRSQRMTVYDVLSYLAAGMTVLDILLDFPDLTQEDIQACFAFVADRERSISIGVAWSYSSIKTLPQDWQSAFPIFFQDQSIQGDPAKNRQLHNNSDRATFSIAID